MEKLTAKELRDKIADGEISSFKATEEVFKRIEKHESVVGAYISTFKDQALKDAKAVDEKIAKGQAAGQLAGVPVAVKDNMCTTFSFTTCGSKILEKFHSPYNATAVQKLIDADAVIIGKTNMDEFAMG
ncbi:MAG: amidase family protein, partial [Planctomycetota bacterium]